ncbi:MAG: hypothetical protein AAB131_22310, partial [Actinomycetota bacterium]
RWYARHPNARHPGARRLSARRLTHGFRFPRRRENAPSPHRGCLLWLHHDWLHRDLFHRDAVAPPCGRSNLHLSGRRRH